MNDARGRRAESPTEIPALGWKDTALRVKDEISDDHTSLVAAGVSFFGFLAFVPGLAAAISIYGLVSEPAQVESQLAGLLGNLPEEAQQLVTDQISRLASQSTGALTWGTFVAVGLALWAASSGMANLIEATNVAYDEEDDRSFLVKRGLALLFTVGAIAVVFATVLCVSAVGPWVSDITGSTAAGLVAQVVTWLLAGVAFVLGLAVLYKVGPDRDDPELRWVSVGSIVATGLWLTASVLFRVYVANFASYHETYGSLAAVVILLFWLYITCFVVLLGAEINAELEHQTRVDTTVGADQPMGQRDAEMADTLGEPRAQQPESSPKWT
jgi:membrane protein